MYEALEECGLVCLEVEVCRSGMWSSGMVLSWPNVTKIREETWFIKCRW